MIQGWADFTTAAKSFLRAIQDEDIDTASHLLDKFEENIAPLLRKTSKPNGIPFHQSQTSADYVGTDLFVLLETMRKWLSALTHLENNNRKAAIAEAQDALAQLHQEEP